MSVVYGFDIKLGIALYTSHFLNTFIIIYIYIYIYIYMNH